MLLPMVLPSAKYERMNVANGQQEAEMIEDKDT
jgi:hypothetical protein